MNDMKRGFVYILSLLISVYPLHPYADEISDTGLDAQTFAKERVEGFNNAPPQNSDGVLTIPLMQNGTFSSEGATSISTADLFPGTSGSGGPMSEYFPDGAEPNLEELQGVSSDGDDMDALGKQNQSLLWDDANSPAPSTTGLAYKVMIDSANMAKPDVSEDPVFNTSREIYDNIESISAEFGDCTTTTTFDNITNSQHIPDYQTCERILDKSNQCEVSHVYDANVIQHYSGPFNILPLDNDSLNVWIGTVGDNYWGGNCTIYEDVTEFVVVNPQAITRVTITQAKWDDYMQIWLGKAGEEAIVWAGPNSNFPPETAGACELSTSWDQNPNHDITAQFLNAVSEGDVVRFKIRVSVTGNGEGFARLQIDYDPSKVVTTDTWSPQECIDAAKGYYDGFASGSVQCTSIPASASSTGCVVINSVTVCEGDMAPSPFPDISPLCESVSVDVDYSFYKGEFCYQAANGENICVNSGDSAQNTCAAYEANPACGFISQTCVQGATAEDGTCYLFDEVWDCGEDIDVPDVVTETNVECAGPVRCMGTDCMTSDKTQSTSFARTSALLNAAQFMTQDMNCVEADGNADVTCDVFSGSPLECKIAVGGVQDCCDVPTNTSAGTYINALFAMGKLDSALMSLDNTNIIKGAYQTLREPVAQTVSEVTKPFTSYAENVSGSVTEFFEPVTAFVDELKQQIKDAIVDTINEMVGDTAANMGADAATSAAADQATDQLAESTGEAVVENVAGAASAFMAAYTAYVVAVMVIQMIYECEEQEFELAAKKDVQSCHYVGSYCADEVLGQCLEKRESYCCFNSPLSRIINEQLRPQLARSFGDPENPDCEGVPMADVGTIDWSLVDLSEWTALLSKHNLLPSPQTINFDSITGSGSDLNRINGSRTNAIDRANTRLEDIDVDEKRQSAYESTPIDPSGN